MFKKLLTRFYTGRGAGGNDILPHATCTNNFHVMQETEKSIVKADFLPDQFAELSDRV